MWASPDVVWGLRVEFTMLAHAPSQKYRKHTAKVGSCTRRPVDHICLSWMGKRIQHHLFPTSLRDEKKIVKWCRSEALVSKFVSSDYQHATIRAKSHFTEGVSINNQVVEEPWLLLQSSVVSSSVADLKDSSNIDSENGVLKCLGGDIPKIKFSIQTGHSEDFNDKFDFDVEETSSSEQDSPLLENYPVEEPWIFESYACTDRSPPKIISVVPSHESAKEDATQSAINEQLQSVPEDLLHEEESNLITKEDSVSTIILINSSICTVQRIAVLENDELVELLLEPVKNNVQCDSVYLGVVTKLVPHMGGAFVNIGSPRPSFMDIKHYKEPFILHPFRGHAKEIDVNGTTCFKPAEQVDFLENGAFSDKIEELDEVEYDQSEDEFVNDDFEGQENCVHSDVLELGEENLNGSVVQHEHEAGAQGASEQLNGDVDQLQTKSVPQDGSIKVKSRESKWAQVQEGSKIIVQVVKEGLGTKSPTLTAYPKLRSRFWVLITRGKTIGISKKISGPERKRLRDIAKTLQPSGFGLTVRTVASGHSLEELQRDLQRLLSTWQSIVDHAKSAALAADEGVDGAVPAMLHRAMGQTLSVVQDYFNEKVKSMIVDSPRTYHEVTNYLQDIAPDLCEKIELYSGRTPLFDEFQIEEEINDLLSKRVPLANGGYLVIEQTEALVSIDVNGGQCMLGQGTSQEEAILEVNLAAAKQIAREFRLRDIGGIIVVDFIDMLEETNRRLVYDEVKRAVERDRSTVKVSELSRHGLMEITRKRVRPSVTFMISEPCTCCHATGRVEALDTSFSKIEHEICRLLSTIDQKADPENPKSWPRFILRVDRHMCNYLTSGKRTRLAVLSTSLKVWILLKVVPGLSRGTFELKPLIGDDTAQKNQQHHRNTISILRPKEVVSYSPTRRKVTLFPNKSWKRGSTS